MTLKIPREMVKGNTQSNGIAYLERLYHLHGPAILRYLYRLIGPKTAEDILQDTFVQAMSHLDRLETAAYPKAWLMTVARNLAINTLRRQNKGVVEMDWSQPVQSKPTEDERLERMRQMIMKLPEDMRETLYLRWYDQLSYEQIAEVMRIPVGTVRSRLHHGLTKLRDQLSDDEQGKRS